MGVKYLYLSFRILYRQSNVRVVPHVTWTRARLTTIRPHRFRAKLQVTASMQVYCGATVFVWASLSNLE